MFKKIVPVFILTLFFTLFFAPVVLAECNCYCKDFAIPPGIVADKYVCDSNCQFRNSEISSCKPCCCQKIGSNEVKEVNFTNDNCVCGSGWLVIDTTSCKSSPGTSAKLTDPLDLKGDIGNLWIRIIKALLAFVAIASLVTFVYAGFIFLISTGNAEKVKKAKDIVVYAILGIFISIASYTILSFIFKTLEGSLTQ